MPRKLEKMRKKQLLEVAFDNNAPLELRYQAARELQYRRDGVLYERLKRKS